MKEKAKKTKITIALVGGGTGGPTTPLLAVAEELQKFNTNIEFCYFGTDTVLEKTLLEPLRIDQYKIPAGKLRRYFSWKNITDTGVVIAGFFVARRILKKRRPKLVFAAGSYVSVPVAYAAFTLGIPVVIHQQDFVASLSNRLIRPIAKKITVSIPTSAVDFSPSFGLWRSKKASNVVVTGNPVRKSFFKNISREQAKKMLGLIGSYPLLLVLGGGSGSAWINHMILECRDELTRHFQIVHITGSKIDLPASTDRNYQSRPYLGSDMATALYASDIVISRAGIGTISELSATHSLALIIPLPHTHQVANAEYLRDRNMALAVSQENLNAEGLVKMLVKLKFDVEVQRHFRENIGRFASPHSGRAIAEIILQS